MNVTNQDMVLRRSITIENGGPALKAATFNDKEKQTWRKQWLCKQFKEAVPHAREHQNLRGDQTLK